MTTTFQESKMGDCILLAPRVPQGLAAAVEGLTREVIRHRPDNVYVFAAHHFERLLRLREQYNADVAEPKSQQQDTRGAEANEAPKQRPGRCSRSANRDSAEQRHTGWTLNETAKVLERHRSIFGESNHKISTEEVRELANERILTSSSKIEESSSNGCVRRRSERHHSVENKNISERYTSSSGKKIESSTSTSPPPPQPPQPSTARAPPSDSRNAPKIISQIPITKDIKTELKRNRMSSKERKRIDDKRMHVSTEYSHETTIEKTSRRTVERTKRSYESRTERSRSSRPEQAGKADKQADKLDPSSGKRPSAPAGMDGIKNYVVQNFIGMTSLDELQTPDYVEKVQEVIDETSSVIKEKVEALKNGVTRQAKQRQPSKELQRHSCSSDDLSKASSKPPESGRKSREGSGRESSRTPAKTAESQKVAPSMWESGSGVDQSESKASDKSEASSESNISLPAVRPPSAKSTPRNVSARSDSDGLVLPPISPESTKSPKIKEDLVLPVLSPPRSSAVTPEDSDNLIDDADEKILQRLTVNADEEFHDSLNVTPELIDAPQRPDSLETSDAEDAAGGPSGRASPAETLRDKLRQIEEVQKRIEGVLDDTASKGDDEATIETTSKDEVKVKSDIQGKLAEIQESERRIEKILDSQSDAAAGSETLNADVRSKLKELEDAERRIADILVGDGDKQSTGEKRDETARHEEQTQGATREADGGEKYGQKESEPNDRVIADDDDDDAGGGKKDTVTAVQEDWEYNTNAYILTEGSPYDIPDTVTTVIIPERTIATPDSDILQVEFENSRIYSTLISSKETKESQETEKTSIHDAFGEVINTDSVETSTVDSNYIRDIKVSHDMIVSRQDLGLIREEHDREAAEEDVIDSEDEKVLKIVTSSLEEILERDEVEYVSKEEVETVARNDHKELGDTSPEIAPHEYESTDETKETSITDGLVENTEAGENSLDIGEITARSAESTNEIKETSITDRSSLSFDPAVPIVPELNLDSLPDLTISSFNNTDDEQKDQKGSKSTSSDLQLSSGSAKEEDKNKILDKAEIKTASIEVESKSETVAEKVQVDENIQEIGKEDHQVATKESSKEVVEKLKTTSEQAADETKASPDEKLDETSTFSESKVQDVVREAETASEQVKPEEIVTKEKSSGESSKQSELEAPETVPDSKIVTTEEKSSRQGELEDSQKVGGVQAQDTIQDIQIAKELMSMDEINVKDSFEEKQGAIDEIPKDVNINKSAPEESVDINKYVCDEDDGDKQTAELVSESQDKLLASENDEAAESEPSPRKAEGSLGIIEQSRLGVIERDESGQLVDTSSTASSQCTAKRLDSDGVSIKTNAGGSVAPQIDQSNATQDGAQTITEKSSSEFNASDASSIARGETEQSADAAQMEKHCQVVGPETSLSKDLSYSTPTSTFLSATTKIQAGIRGFLIRRRLQSSQYLSSTLDSVPSIQGSLVGESSAGGEADSPPVLDGCSARAMPHSKTRGKLRREDAVRRTTLSLDNAFAEKCVQHTGEFHDCIPLPVFGAESLGMARRSSGGGGGGGGDGPRSSPEESLGEQLLMGKMLLGQPAPFVDVVLLPPGEADAVLQSGYLNFITSVEDVAAELFHKPGVIIEEITSLDGASEGRRSEIDSVSAADEPLDSASVQELLGLGEQGEPARKLSRAAVNKLTAVGRLASGRSPAAPSELPRSEPTDSSECCTDASPHE